MTAIEWTDATWNPSTGCTKVSAGCKHCYAETMAKRLKKMKKPKYANGFEYAEHESALELPLTWKKPRRVFVNSMSDLFHEQATDAFISKCFDVMLKANQHTYQVLTKRPERMMQFVDEYVEKRGPLPRNIWLGTSVENEAAAHRIEKLKYVNCAIRFISFEPLIGPIDIGADDLRGISWAIIGGESGRYHRPVDPNWARNLIKSCKEQGVAVFFKQWGGEYPTQNGREIDGRTWDEYPTSKAMQTKL